MCSWKIELYEVVEKQLICGTKKKQLLWQRFISLFLNYCWITSFNTFVFFCCIFLTTSSTITFNNTSLFSYNTFITTSCTTYFFYTINLHDDLTWRMLEALWVILTNVNLNFKCKATNNLQSRSRDGSLRLTTPAALTAKVS